MSTSVTTAFASGVSGVMDYGQRDAFTFFPVDFGYYTGAFPNIGAWAHGDTYSVDVASTTGNFTLGKGTIGGLTTSYAYTYRNRVYLAAGDSYAYFSDNGDPTGWNTQNPGAGRVFYNSQYGTQDYVVAYGQLQGRLAIFAKNSIQLWTTDADPSLFALQQTFDNIGTFAPLSVQSLGDYDVLFLDYSGLRSLRSRELTLNAFVNDVGSPIDNVLQGVLAGYDASGSCSVVEPTSKRYWIFIKDTIYVLSRFPNEGISAWTTYDPIDSTGTGFVPQKFVVYQGQVFCRDTTGKFLAYGGPNGTLYDGSIVTVELPWLDGGDGTLRKSIVGINCAISGSWSAYVSVDPKGWATAAPLAVINTNASSAANPSTEKDSTYDNGTIGFTGMGTHIKIKLVSDQTMTKEAVLSDVLVNYNPGNKQ